MFSVLVVDDEPKHRRGLTLMIRELRPDYRIYDAKDGLEALQCMDANPVDIIITDIEMPVMNGLQFIENLGERAHDTLVVILSAYSRFEYAQKAIRLGAADYLLKPVAETKVEEMLSELETKIRAERTNRGSLQVSTGQQWRAAARPNPGEEKEIAASFTFLESSHAASVLEDAAINADKKRLRNEAVIESCKAYIECHFTEDLSLGALAAKFHFNPSYFCLLFRTHTQTTISDYILKTRMRHAEYLLTSTPRKVYEIARMVGYRDVKYFIRLFRKEFGSAPDEYRHMAGHR